MANISGRFIWYELMTTDVAAAKTFYAKVVGWGMEDVPAPGMEYALCIAGRASVAGIMNLPADAKAAGMKPRWTGFVAVDDVDAAARRIKTLGGAVLVGPAEIPDISRFAVFDDEQMAMLGVIKWLRPRPDEPAALRMLRRVGWHELLTNDRERALAFYAKLFGWQKAATEGEYYLFSAAEETIGGIDTKGGEVPAPFWLYYFNVGDIAAAAQRVKAAGGKVLDGPMLWADGRTTLACADPQGAMFALVAKPRGMDVGYFPRGPRAT